MRVDINIYSPSLLHTLEDYILHIGLLMMCCRFYTEDDDCPVRDFMISPLFTPTQILKDYSKVYLMICERDPLHDDSVRFLLKLLWFN